MEANPFRPDIPVGIADLGGGLYDYLREQAELIREQHNNYQAGDSTFPWHLISVTGKTLVHTPGSLTRFVHETYGLLHGRYVRFSDNWKFADHPFVGHDKTRNDWTATNVAAKTDKFRVIGVCGAALSDVTELYGWVITNGRGPFEIIVEAESPPTAFQRISWNPNGGVASVAPGPQVALILSDGPFEEKLTDEGASYIPPRWTIPAGDWFADVHGDTPEYILEVARQITDGLDERLTELELTGLAGGGTGTNFLQSQIDSIKSQLTLEIKSRSQSVTGLNVRVTALEAYDLNTFATIESLTALAVQVTNNRTLYDGFVTTTNAQIGGVISRVSHLESWQGVTNSQLTGIFQSIQQLNEREYLLRYCRLIPSEPQTIAAAADTRVELGIVEIDAGGVALDVGTASQIVIGTNVSYIRVSAGIASNTGVLTAGSTYTLSVRVNGVAVQSKTIFAGHINHADEFTSRILPVTAGDYVELFLEPHDTDYVVADSAMTFLEVEVVYARSNSV